jgi:hypothetical protein
MVGSESTVHTYSVADLHCSDVGLDPTCYFDADPVQQASIISNEIGMFVINVLKLKIAKIIRILG